MSIRTANGVRHRAPSTPPKLDPRPLYIAPAQDVRVDLDGPALRVTREETAEQLFPLQRISRVYSAPTTDWSLEALLACADMGIGVLFVADDGDILARVLGRPGERDELHTRLTEFLLLPQAMDMYYWWLDKAERRVSHWASVKLGVPRAQREPAQCREWINQEAVRFAGQTEAERSRQWLRSIAYSWMQAHLQDLGFGKNNELALSGEPALTRDLTHVFFWYLEPARLGWLKKRYLAARRKNEPLRAVERRDVVRLFESRAVRASARGRDITSALHRWLVHET